MTLPSDPIVDSAIVASMIVVGGFILALAVLAAWREFKRSEAPPVERRKRRRGP